jgi:hypothetical protein
MFNKYTFPRTFRTITVNKGVDLSRYPRFILSIIILPGEKKPAYHPIVEYVPSEAASPHGAGGFHDLCRRSSARTLPFWVLQLSGVSRS